MNFHIFKANISEVLRINRYVFKWQVISIIEFMNRREVYGLSALLCLLLARTLFIWRGSPRWLGKFTIAQLSTSWRTFRLHLGWLEWPKCSSLSRTFWKCFRHLFLSTFNQRSYNWTTLLHFFPRYLSTRTQ